MMAQPGLRFAYRLGAHLGCANIPKMLRGMTSTQLLRWEAFYEEEPFGFEVDNHRAGMIAATVANCARSKRSDKSFRPTDFFPTRGGPKEPSQAAKTRAGFAALAARQAKRGK